MRGSFLLVLSLASAVAGGSAAVSEPAPPHIYAVIFEAKVSSDGKVTSLVVSKVVDPASAGADPVKMDVPQVFITAALEKLRQRNYPADTGHFFTYNYFDPGRPGDADVDPTAGQP